MNCILLIGAGFSYNWGGRLASEVRAELQSRLSHEPHLAQLLNKADFESALATIQAAHERRGDERSLQLIQSAISDVFSAMNRSFQRRGTLEFGNDVAFSIQRYLAKFDAIFSVNQDLLLELLYRRDDPSVWHGTRWSGYQLPGVTEIPHTEGLVDRLKSRWVPDGEFGIDPRQQPLIKLHGSSNWYTKGTTPLLVMGAGKGSQIASYQLLRRYFEYFRDCLSIPDTRLVVIGYGFGDDHINRELVEAGRRHALKMMVVGPEGRKPLVKNPGAMIPPPEPLRDDITSLGESVRSLRNTFTSDELERDLLYRVFEPRTSE